MKKVRINISLCVLICHFPLYENLTGCKTGLIYRLERNCMLGYLATYRFIKFTIFSDSCWFKMITWSDRGHPRMADTF